MSLARIFTDLYGEAAQTASGTAERRLAKGAAITVRVQGLRRQVILTRGGAPIGEVEEQTFRAHGRIPESAERAEYIVKEHWYKVALTWEEAPGLFDEEPSDA